MSQTPTARSTPAGSPAPRPTINLENIYNNIPILINRVRTNQLAANQIPPLRNLIANHAKEIIVFHARLGKGNPIIGLPDSLNPTKKVGTSEAITTEQAFLASIQSGINAAKHIKPDQNLISAMNAKLAAVRTAPAPAPAKTASTTSSAGPSPSPSQETAPAAQPNIPLLSPIQLKELMGMPTDQRNLKLEADPALKQRFIVTCQFYSRKNVRQQAPPAAAAAPTEAAPSPVVKSATAPAPQPASNAASPASSPALGSAPPPPPAAAAAAAAQAHQAAAQAKGTSAPPPPAVSTSTPATVQPTSAPPPTTAPAPAAPALPPTAAPSSSSSTVVTSAPIPTPPVPTSASTAPPPPTLAPVIAPPAPPPRMRTPSPPPPPPEPEDVRRKRKLREYMSELAPDLNVELGLDDLFSDVLDSLVDTVAKDSIRMAAHRGASKVELKDMSFVLDHYHQIVVPGFNAQVPKRVHLEPDGGDRKRGKAVMRRSGRKEDE